MDAKMRADFVNSVASGQKVPCPVCNTLNDPDGSFCIACGHSLKKEEKKESCQKNIPQNTPKKKPLLRRVLLILGIFAAIIFGMMSCLAPKIKNVTIDDLDWERTIDIEEVVTHNESDWSLPDDARLQYTKSEIQSYKDVLDHYETVTETKTRSVIDHYEEKSSYVDLGNG